jgi:MoaA/NifB/PqqE/SkfB family radical SAM enzyme
MARMNCGDAGMNTPVLGATPSIAAPSADGRRRWKQRLSAAGVHLFDRATGLNVLLDEIPVPASLHSRAPRQVSIALTNRCDLACSHCYAPKSRDELRFDAITGWLAELDGHDTLGIGFGGGEPTLYPEFARLCQHVAQETRLAVSFTTHGHHVDGDLAEHLRGSVHFIRVSMDGTGATYESIRRRSFPELIARLENVRAISPFGVNVVVNGRTLPDLDGVARVAADAGACELLLLPQMPVRSVEATSVGTVQGLRRWVDAYRGPLKLCINEASAEGFPTCDPLFEERGLRAYAHIDAMGVLKPSSYAETGVQLGEGGVLQALDKLAHDLAGNEA